MGWSQIVFGSVLVGVLLLLSVYYGRRQFVALRRLRNETLPGEEARHERAKAVRRLVACGVQLILGLLLAGILLWLEPETQRIIDGFKGEADPEYTDAQKQLLRVWGGAWVAVLVLLLIVVGFAAVDLWSTRGHALRQFRKLQADRRAMIARQTGRLREEREQG